MTFCFVKKAAGNPCIRITGGWASLRLGVFQVISVDSDLLYGISYKSRSDIPLESDSRYSVAYTLIAPAAHSIMTSSVLYSLPKISVIWN